MIAKFKLFLNPQTSEETRSRITAVLICTTAVLFVALAACRWHELRSTAYFSDGETVLKLSADDTVTIYRSR